MTQYNLFSENKQLDFFSKKQKKKVNKIFKNQRKYQIYM